MLKSLFYVSNKVTPWPHDEADVKAITEVARSRNGALGITGALVSTDQHFAQIIEGPDAAVDAVMNSIFSDVRHTDVTLLEIAHREARWYPQWALAYAGRASYISARIKPLLVPNPEPTAIITLSKMMQAFSLET